MKKIFTTLAILFSFTLSTVVVSAQQVTNLSTASSAYCPYTFTRDLKTGSTGLDVKVLQQILNSDQRTVIAANGIASPGQETTSYGVATREAVKKFQALFIEYIGVANGVFGPKTRTVMNAVCNGEYYNSGKGQVYSGVSTQNTVNNNVSSATSTTASTSVDKVAPAIYLRSNSTAINSGLAFRIIVTASEPIQAFTPESIIIEGGTVSDIRKLSPNSYSLLVTPSEGVKAVVAQVEADKVLDLSGNKNDNASNEIRVAINYPVATATTTTNATASTGVTSGELDSIFNRILAQVTPATSTVAQPTTCSNGATNPPSCNNNYNSSPNYNSGSNSGNQQNSLMNMLLLSRLLGGNNGGGLFGGSGSNNNSGCSGLAAMFGSCKSPSVAQTGAGGGSSAADIQACANGDKTKCTSGGTPADVPTPPVKPGEVTFNGGKIEKIYACEAEAPALTGETSQLKNHTTKTSVFLKIIATDQKSRTVIRYGKDMDAQQDAAKRMAENSCYVDGQVTKRAEQLICCKQVQYNATGQRYTCIPHTDLGQEKATYYFKDKVDFAQKNCTVGQQATTTNPFQGQFNGQTPTSSSSFEPYSNSPNNKDTTNPFQGQFSGQTPNTDPISNQVGEPLAPNTMSAQQCVDYANSLVASRGIDECIAFECRRIIINSAIAETETYSTWCKGILKQSSVFPKTVTTK